MTIIYELINKQSNYTPTVTIISKIGIDDTVLLFNTAGSSNNFNYLDEGTLKKIEAATLPTNKILKSLDIETSSTLTQKSIEKFNLISTNNIFNLAIGITGMLVTSNPTFLLFSIVGLLPTVCADGLVMEELSLIKEIFPGSYGSVSTSVLSNNDHVISWIGPAGDSNDIYFQHFNLSGTSTTPEMQIEISPYIVEHVATGLSSGRYVLLYMTGSIPGERSIYGRCHEEDDTLIGSEFLVGTFTDTSSLDKAMSVTSFSDDTFVVVWGCYNIFGRRFSSNGVAIDSAFQISDTEVITRHPYVASLLNNDFVVIWTEHFSEIDTLFIKGRKFLSDETPVHSIFQVDYLYSFIQSYPSVTGLSDGGLLVAWVQYPNIWGQRYSSNLTEIGSQFSFNTQAGVSDPTHIVGSVSEGFIVTWGYSGYSRGKHCKLVGNSFLFSPEYSFATTTKKMATAMLPNGNFISVPYFSHYYEYYYEWEGKIYWRLIEVDHTPTLLKNQLAIYEGETVTVTSNNLSAMDIEESNSTLLFSVDDVQHGQFEKSDNPGNAITQFTQEEIVNNEIKFIHDSGEEPPSYKASVGDSLTNSLFQSANISFTPVNDLPIVSTVFKSGIESSMVTFNTNDFTDRFDDADGDSLIKIKIVSLPTHGTLKLLEETITENQEINIGNLSNVIFYPSNWSGTTNFDWKGYDGTAYSDNVASVDVTIVPLNSLVSYVSGEEFLINTITADTQAGGAAAKAGNQFIVVWQNTIILPPRTILNYDVYSKRFNFDGDQQGSQIIISDASSPDVVGLVNGGYVIVWNDRALSPNPPWYIRAQRYDANGNPQGSTITVSECGEKYNLPRVSALTGEGATTGFVVAWQHSYVGETTHFMISAQRYDTSGNPQGSFITVSNHGSDTSPAVVGLEYGKFVVVWKYSGVRAQRYDANGNLEGDTIVISSSGEYPSIANLQNSDFVVSWRDNSDGYCYAQRYDINGNIQGNEIIVSSSCTSSSVDYFHGGFIITWTSSEDVYGQRYDIFGNTQGDVFLINAYTTGAQSGGHVEILNEEKFVVTWSGAGQEDSTGVYKKLYQKHYLPIVSTIFKAGVEDTVLIFSTTDFTNHFNDADGNNLTKIQIISLPERGILKLSGTNVIVDQEIDVNDLTGLTFEPTENWNGNTIFEWKGHDGTEYSSNSAEVIINIEEINDAPIVFYSLSNKAIHHETLFKMVIPYDIFSDSDGDTLSISIKQTDNSDLPNWLTIEENPILPNLISSLNTTGYASGITIVGNYAYIADGWSGVSAGLRIVDVTNPSIPNLVGSLDTWDPWNVVVLGNYAYVADGSAGLKIVNITDPAMPNLISELDTDGSTWQVTVAGNYAYLADYGAGIKVVNITNPLTPTLVGSLDTSGYASAIKIVGNYAYVADGWSGVSAGLRIINIANPSITPSLSGSLELWDCWDVAISGNYAYIADGFAGLKIVNITNPAIPNLISELDTNGTAVGITVVENYAYVADHVAGLKIIDITNSSAPNLIASLNTDGNAQKVSIVGDYAYVANYNEGLKIIEGVGRGLKLIGTPTLSDVGQLNLKVIASDSVEEVFTELSIDVQNASPTVETFSKLGTEDTILTFNATDFTAHFDDIEEDALTKIIITTLPNGGNLKLLSSLVIKDQEINIDHLDSLRFEPNPNWNGNTTFDWRGFDGIEYSENTANVNIIIGAVNDAPTVTNVYKIGTEDTVLTFNITDFTNQFNDIDNDFN